MRIKKLHLKNFRQFEDLEINFPETSNVVVFIGENGCGKSTVLDAAAFYLEQIADRAITRKNSSDNRIKYPNIKDIRRSNIKEI